MERLGLPPSLLFMNKNKKIIHRRRISQWLLHHSPTSSSPEALSESSGHKLQHSLQSSHKKNH